MKTTLSSPNKNLLILSPPMSLVPISLSSHIFRPTIAFPNFHKIPSKYCKMQAAMFSVSQPLPLPKPTKTLGSSWKSVPRLRASSFRHPVRAVAVPNDSSTADYSSQSSVFPAEACETIGGDACSVEMYPEVKLPPKADKGMPKTASESMDREYYEYNSSKTVFPAEACDDLGGEFCGADYQKGVY